jgi:nucleoside-diphosphate-sugar epimerase
MDESAPVNPTPLAAWRAEHEPLVLESNGGGMRAIVVRPGIVYGGADGIISGMLREADNSIMRVIGTGENHWPMVYDRDLADLYVKLVAHPEASGIFHATDDGEERVIDLVKAMSRHVEFTPEIRYMPLPEARAKLGTYADALALDQIVRSPRAREIGWHPTLKSASRNVPRLFEEWRNGRG